jgi:hypothetical protein
MFLSNFILATAGFVQKPKRSKPVSENPTNAGKKSHILLVMAVPANEAELKI